jgi:hypothetical protein
MVDESIELRGIAMVFVGWVGGMRVVADVEVL